MRLFGYYVSHTFKNQVKKLLRSWFLAFILICALMGGLIGYGAASLSEAAEQQEETVEVVLETPEPLFDPMERLELISGAVILLVLAYEAVSSDKHGSAIFLPADVNLLFPSPMKPQSILMFRLATRLGTAVAASIYLLLEIPVLASGMDLSPGAAASIIVGWGLTILTGKLLQVLLYLIGSEHPVFRRAVRPAVYGLLGLVAVAYLALWRIGGGTPARAAVRMFTGDLSRAVPVWGWIKGFFLYLCEGRIVPGLVCLAGVLAVGAALVILIRRQKADFYEDAMARSEETAALQRKAQEGKGVAFRTRTKDRSKALRRDGLWGFGARVFFHKTLYNRFRFAKLYVLTKTSVTYLLAAGGVSLLCRLVLETNSFVPAALTLGVLVFFRALGNPLDTDTGVDWFRLIPASTASKLLWSLLGGTVCCLLDMLPAVIVSTVILGSNPLLSLVWMLFIVTVDFYSTIVGTFIDLSVPQSIGKTVKQLVQVMFVYFGLLPDIALIAVGLAFDILPGMAAAAAGVNLLLGTVFLFLCPRFLEGGSTGMPVRLLSPWVLKRARRSFSRVGLSVFVTFALGTGGQIGFQALLDWLWPEVLEKSWSIWLVSFVPLYLVAVPVGLLLFRLVPRAPIPQSRPKIRYMLATIPICMFLMYAGNVVGIAVTLLSQLVLDITSVNPLFDLVTGSSIWLRLGIMVVLAPMIEELIFRRSIIDRIRIYGEKRAVVLSALLFGLFHGNFSQFFYAFALGLAFGFVYLRTGRLRYTICLHMLINFMGGILAPELLTLVDLEALETMESLDALLQPGMLVLLAYGALIANLAIFGLVMLCVHSRKIRFATAPLELPRGVRFKTAYLNPGMILAFLLLIAAMVYSLG